MSRTKIIVSIIEILAGIGLVVAACFGAVDSFWSGMGGALAAVGLISTIRNFRLNRNPEYKEKYETEINDERNRFISTKAWSWAGYLFVMITAIGTIVCKLLGREDLMMFCSGCVCLVLVLYWLSYLVLKNKY